MNRPDLSALDANTIKLPEWGHLNAAEVAAGWFSASYFNKTRQILQGFGSYEPVVMQVFQKHQSMVCGTIEAAAMLKRCVQAQATEFDDPWWDLAVYILPDGEIAMPWDPIMYIEGPLAHFAHLESVYLGIIRQQTTVATNIAMAVEAADGKPVFYLADRFNHFSNQPGQGYAAHVGGAEMLCTEAMCERVPRAKAAGTMPHALIAACGGDTVAACQAYKAVFPDDRLVALVDFKNDVIATSLEVCEKVDGVYAVRVDTSEKMVDKSFDPAHPCYDKAVRRYPDSVHGVNPFLIKNLRSHLDIAGFHDVKIAVSGGFNYEKIRRFEEVETPVDIYGVGSSALQGGSDITADVVWPTSKVGRSFKYDDRLVRVV